MQVYPYRMHVNQPSGSTEWIFVTFKTESSINCIIGLSPFYSLINTIIEIIPTNGDNLTRILFKMAKN